MPRGQQGPEQRPPGGAAVVDHHQQAPAGAQHAPRLGHRAEEIARVVQAADRDDVVEGGIGERQRECGALHDLVGPRAGHASEPGAHHRHRAGREVEPVVIGAAACQPLAERAVAKPDLQRLPAGEGVRRDVAEEVRVEREVRLVEARQRRLRGVVDADLAREVGAAELVPEGGVAVVEGCVADHVRPGVQATRGPAALRPPREPRLAFMRAVRAGTAGAVAAAPATTHSRGT